MSSDAEAMKLKNLFSQTTSSSIHSTPCFSSSIHVLWPGSLGQLQQQVPVNPAATWQTSQYKVSGGISGSHSHSKTASSIDCSYNLCVPPKYFPTKLLPLDEKMGKLWEKNSPCTCEQILSAKLILTHNEWERNSHWEDFPEPVGKLKNWAHKKTAKI